MKLKKGDQVLVTVGKNRGMKGKISKVFPKTGKILLPGINVYKKHVKPQGEGKPGGIVDVVKPLSVTNVALVCPKCGKATRIGYQVSKKGPSTKLRVNKLRICKKCKAVI